MPPVVYLTIWCPVCWFKDEKYEMDEETEPLFQTPQLVAEKVHTMMHPRCRGPVRYSIKRDSQ